MNDSSNLASPTWQTSLQPKSSAAGISAYRIGLDRIGACVLGTCVLVATSLIDNSPANGQTTPVAETEQWPQWRGVDGDNHAPESAKVPLRWDFQSGYNIHWKVKIPGRGHSTPIVVDDGIFMTTADSDAGTQSLIKVGLETGLVVDQWVIHRNTLPANIHPNNSFASPSAAYDGERVIVSFHTNDAIWLTAMTTSGREEWRTKVCRFEPSMFQFGYGASPIIENGLVIVAAEYDGADSGLYAFDCRTGKKVWKTKRPENLNFASPIVYTIAGQRQILLAGAEMMAAYDVTTGRLIWKVDTTTEAICGTVVCDNRRVLVSGGNPKSGIWCVLADGSQKLLWDNNVKCYEQSLLTIDNYVFAFADSGVAYCFRTADGKEMWKRRLFSGGISSSPVLVGDRIFVGDERGTIYVVKASPDRFELMGENPSGDSLFASPVVVSDRMYLRTATGSGSDRQEYLVAIKSK